MCATVRMSYPVSFSYTIGNSKPEEVTSLDPFNHYNTEFIKLDAKGVPNQEDISSNSLLASAQFTLLTPDEDLVDSPIMISDSINNKSFTDVTFIVGPPQHSKKYVGHRVLLAMTSPGEYKVYKDLSSVEDFLDTDYISTLFKSIVFETMFYGDMADKNKYIRIVDVAPIGFENLLRYAYTDSLNLSTVEDAMLTAYAAKKYLLPQLLRECLTYIELNISPGTACVVFEFAQVLNSQQLVLQAMNLIDRQTSAVIASKSFVHAQASTVEFLANRKYLNPGSEFALFSAILNWSLSEAKRRQLINSTSNPDWPSIRSILSEYSILNAIRFLAMTSEEFVRVIAATSATCSGVKSENDLSKTANGNGSTEAKPPTTNQSTTNSSASQQLPKPLTGASDSINELELDDSNSLLTIKEQRAVLLNLVTPNFAKIPQSLSTQKETRQPPPDYFTLRRFKLSSSNSNLTATTTTTRNIKSISTKFQCLSENIFIVALTIPIRLDTSSIYTTRTPKFECHLKFTTKTTTKNSTGFTLEQNSSTSTEQANQSATPVAGPLDSAALLMDTIDESLYISIARDRDCLVRLKRPILIRMGNINELSLTFQTYALDEDIVALQVPPKVRSANFSEQLDGENISWLFFRTANIEFSEIHYYY